MRRGERLRIANTILKKNNQVERLISPDIKFYSETTILKTEQSSRSMGGRGDSDRPTQAWLTTPCQKDNKQFHGERKHFNN